MTDALWRLSGSTIAREIFKMSDVRIAGLSDVTSGYAVPQFELFIESLAKYYDPATAFILEPDMKGRRSMRVNPLVNFRRFCTRMPPHDELFHIDYNIQLLKFLNDFDPNIVVIVNAAVIPALLLMREKPDFVIYYMLESLSLQLHAGGEHYLDLNHMVRDSVDLIVVPELRRASVDMKSLGWTNKPTVQILNVSNTEFEPGAVVEQCRFLYAGTIGPQCCCDYLFDERLGNLQIDVAGPVDSESARSLVKRMSDTGGRIRYLGLLPTIELKAILHDYAFRIVSWKPNDINTVFASPNKLFESIAVGIPPIATPQPQCVEVIEEFECGIIIDDWGVDAFVRALEYANTIFQTEKYFSLVRNCKKAVDSSLNWGRQFMEVEPYLRPRSTILRENERQRFSGSLIDELVKPGI